MINKVSPALRRYTPGEISKNVKNRVDQNSNFEEQDKNEISNVNGEVEVINLKNVVSVKNNSSSTNIYQSQLPRQSELEKQIINKYEINFNELDQAFTKLRYNLYKNIKYSRKMEGYCKLKENIFKSKSDGIIVCNRVINYPYCKRDIATPDDNCNKFVFLIKFSVG